MAKTQDLPLNPSKVSGVCGRLLCCLSYENDQYKQMKATMPRLGQPIDSPAGPGMVVSMQLLKDLITVRLASDNTDHVFSGRDLGLRRAEPPAPQVKAEPRVEAPVVLPSDKATDEISNDAAVQPEEAKSGGRRRRRRGRGNRRGGGPPQTQA